MLFNSYIFILIFLPLTLFAYYTVGKVAGAKAARLILVFASLGFYMWWNPIYIVLLLGSIAGNFILSQLILGAPRAKAGEGGWHRRKLLLLLGITLNLAFLGYFKYADFFISNVSTLLATEWSLLNIVLPLAISFFTLQQIAYLVDVYEGLVEERSASDYLLFVCFFPQLIAGPIVHHNEVMPQFRDREAIRFNHRNFSLGLFIFSVGLFKKVVIADSLAGYVETGFDSDFTISMAEAWLASFAYTMQMYFDFSGYSDMAVGLGLLFNINLPINFNSPFKTTSIISFWQHWHITLTNFINTYLYVPLVRLHSGFSFTWSMLVTVVVMAIVGLWHGAGWNFVLFGTMHGVALVVNHIWQRFNRPLPAWLGWLLTIGWFFLSLIVFRCDSPEKAWRMFDAMINGPVGQLSEEMYGTFLTILPLPDRFSTPLIVVALLLCLASCLLLKNPHEHRETFKPSAKYFAITLFCFASSILWLDRVVEFIYFQF